ncbi:Uncharacterized protein dnm_003220 [Desulfonema magnum]|uniref:Uncharacterized protein n=1 Tax=Desulfonema magnum TaxID=45655 RepID=A0A975GL14_9BACT|nr:Uncharacterized protein dnm_003220 [Desulfonema magnum]
MSSVERNDRKELDDRMIMRPAERPEMSGIASAICGMAGSLL